MHLSPRSWPLCLVLALTQDGALPRESDAIRLGGSTPGGVTATRDLTGEGTAFLEIVPDATAVLVEQRVHLTIRAGLAEDFVEQHLVQLFPRALDLPVQLDLSSLDALPAVHSAQGPRLEGGPTLAVDEDIVRVAPLEVIERGGRRYRTVSLERTLRPTLPGTIRVPATTLRFAYTTRFEDDVFQGRVATDRIDAHVSSAPVEISVQPWPEDGRPPGFGGAVGRFTLRAAAEPRDLRLGESLRLTLTFGGSGNLDSFDAPRLDDLRGFDVLGLLDEYEDGRRTISCDLVPRRADVREIPAIPFITLDPGPPPTYRVLETLALPILVRPAAREAAGPTSSARPGDASPTREEPGFQTWTWLIGGTLVGLLAAWLLRRLRRRSDPSY